MDNNAKRIVLGGLLIVIGIILPQILHMIGGQILGQFLSPMHLPVFLAGLILGPYYGCFIGLIIPLLSFLLTGMPPILPPILIMMMAELAAYGVCSGILYFYFKKNIYFTLIMSMLIGRAVYGMALLWLAPLFNFHPPFWKFMQGVLLTGIPGIILQLVFVPLFVKMIFKKTSLI